MKKVIEVENKTITIFYNEVSKHDEIPVVVLDVFDEDGQDIWDKVRDLSNKEFVLVSISNIDWNKEMTPWYIDKLFKGEDEYAGEADKYLTILTEKIIPNVEKVINEVVGKKVSSYSLAGYSLAGLFAVYSLYKTDIFKNIISCSGSLWYPEFIEFIETNELKANPDKIYFSLGNKESKTRNELMAKVEEKTKYVEQYFKNKNIKTIYEVNEGNHFQDVTDRLVKGICWSLN